MLKNRYNGTMYEFHPYFTNDGSVGLFSPEADDIYHSTYGALTEAYEKFILPAEFENYFEKNNEIKILDICFGIGYNTKSFLNFFSENNLLKKQYNDSIGTNKILRNKSNEKIYTNNKKYKIFIHAIDTDKNLAYISPFIKSFEKNIEKINSKSPITHKQEKIKRMLEKEAKPKFKLRKEINIIMLEKLINHIDNEAESIIYDKKYTPYFDRRIIALYELLKNKRMFYTPWKKIKTFLHNIYYQYLSMSYKKALNTLKLIDFDFILDIKDARRAIESDSYKYNLIFLDAFTPTKCPCLWTVDFFKLLFNHLEDDGMILTYSNSAQVRNAFLNAGFYVGKIYSQSLNKFTGTIATKNSNLIKYELSEYDLGLMKTRAGIFYRDENLTLDNKAIIEAHKTEVKNSNLISSSKYIRNNAKKF